MAIDIRSAQSTDIPQFVTLMGELGYEANPESLELLILEIRKGYGEVLVAEMEGLVVGCINAIIDLRLAEGRTGEIASLVVSAQHRGCGIGGALLQHAEDWLQSRVNLIRIRANVKRASSHQFYASAGYAEIKEQKVFIKNV